MQKFIQLTSEIPLGEIMSRLEEIFQMDCVYSVGKLDDMGRLVDWKAKQVVDKELKDNTMNFIESIRSTMLQAGRYAKKNWLPMGFLIYRGGDITFLIADDYVLFMDTAKIDSDWLLKAFPSLDIFKK